MQNDKPLPEIDPINSQFFKGLSEDKLLIQKCIKCGNTQFYPKAICVKCYSVDLEWIKSSGEGKVYSFTEINRVIMNSKEFEKEVPYVIASVELKEGVRLYSRILSENGKNVKIGDSVRVVFRTVSEEIGLPEFKLL